MNEDEFFAKYKPIESPDGSTIWQRDELVIAGKSLYPDKQVWTYVCDEYDGAIAGWHVVNMVGYIVTEVPWVDGGEWMVFDSTCHWCSESIREDESGSWGACTESPTGKHDPNPDDEDEEEDDEDEDGAPREQWEVTDPLQHAERDTRGEHDPTL